MDQRLRLLAHWHARRRQVDELMTPLLACGPAAVQRVYARLPELTQAMSAEREAFEAFATATGPGSAQRSGDQRGCSVPVDELARARRRATTRAPTGC